MGNFLQLKLCQKLKRLISDENNPDYPDLFWLLAAVAGGGAGGGTTRPCLLSLLMTCVMSMAAAVLAFCSCSICRRTMGLKLGLRFLAFCSSWASLGGREEQRKVRVRSDRWSGTPRNAATHLNLCSSGQTAFLSVSLNTEDFMYRPYESCTHSNDERAEVTEEWVRGVTECGVEEAAFHLPA